MSLDIEPRSAAAGAGVSDEEIMAASRWVSPLRAEIGRYLIGQHELVDRLIAVLLVRGHVLLEGVPGLAKTLALKTLAQLVHASFHRIQFTPDVLRHRVVVSYVSEAEGLNAEHFIRQILDEMPVP